MSKQREVELADIGKKLANAQTKEALMKLLPQAANMLEDVEQLPPPSTIFAMKACSDALVDPAVLGHKDKDVGVLVALCISEIMRIVAPDAPYSDDCLKEIFQLIVGIFRGLGDVHSPSFSSRANILETVAKVRSCVVMLDLDCDDLITEMFEIFFTTASDKHPEHVFLAMRNILSLVIEEGEEVSSHILEVILNNLLKRKEGISPAGRKLAVAVVEKCGEILEPYVQQFLTLARLEGRRRGGGGQGSQQQQTPLEKDYHELVYELYCCTPQMLLGVLHHLREDLEWNQVPVRLKATMLLGRMFALPGRPVAPENRHLFSEFLKKLDDKDIDVRAAAINGAKACLEMMDPSSMETSEILVALGDHLCCADDGMRVAAMNIICDFARKYPYIGRPGILRKVADCLQDTKASIRVETLHKLAGVYRSYCTKCFQGLEAVHDWFEWIPSEILRSCYRKGSADFIAQDMEMVICNELFDAEQLPVAEQAKHWIAIFSMFDERDKTALQQILSQKRRLQSEMLVYVSEQQTAKEKETPDFQRKIESSFTVIADQFVDPPKAKEALWELHKMSDDDDAAVFKQLSILLDPSTSTAHARAVSAELLKRIGTNHPQHDFLKILTTKCAYLLFGREHAWTLIQEILLHKNASRKGQMLSAIDLLSEVAAYGPTLIDDDVTEKLQLSSKDDEEFIRNGVLNIIKLEDRDRTKSAVAEIAMSADPGLSSAALNESRPQCQKPGSGDAETVLEGDEAEPIDEDANRNKGEWNDDIVPATKGAAGVESTPGLAEKAVADADGEKEREEAEEEEEEEEETVLVKRKRGRPKGSFKKPYRAKSISRIGPTKAPIALNNAQDGTEQRDDGDEKPPVKRKRGRPPKVSSNNKDVSEVAKEAVKDGAKDECVDYDHAEKPPEADGTNTQLEVEEEEVVAELENRENDESKIEEAADVVNPDEDEDGTKEKEKDGIEEVADVVEPDEDEDGKKEKEKDGIEEATDVVRPEDEDGMMEGKDGIEEAADVVNPAEDEDGMKEGKDGIEEAADVGKPDEDEDEDEDEDGMTEKKKDGIEEAADVVKPDEDEDGMTEEKDGIEEAADVVKPDEDEDGMKEKEKDGIEEVADVVKPDEDEDEDGMKENEKDGIHRVVDVEKPDGSKDRDIDKLEANAEDDATERNENGTAIENHGEGDAAKELVDNDDTTTKDGEFHNREKEEVGCGEVPDKDESDENRPRGQEDLEHRKEHGVTVDKVERSDDAQGKEASEHQEAERFDEAEEGGGLEERDADKTNMVAAEGTKEGRKEGGGGLEERDADETNTVATEGTTDVKEEGGPEERDADGMKEDVDGFNGDEGKGPSEKDDDAGTNREGGSEGREEDRVEDRAEDDAIVDREATRARDRKEDGEDEEEGDGGVVPAWKPDVREEGETEREDEEDAEKTRKSDTGGRKDGDAETDPHRQQEDLSTKRKRGRPKGSGRKPKHRRPGRSLGKKDVEEVALKVEMRADPRIDGVDATEKVAEETPGEDTTEKKVAEETPGEDTTEKKLAEEMLGEDATEKMVAKETPGEDTTEKVAEETPRRPSTEEEEGEKDQEKRHLPATRKRGRSKSVRSKANAWGTPRNVTDGKSDVTDGKSDGTDRKSEPEKDDDAVDREENLRAKRKHLPEGSSKHDAVGAGDRERSGENRHVTEISRKDEDGEAGLDHQDAEQTETDEREGQKADRVGNLSRKKRKAGRPKGSAAKKNKRKLSMGGDDEKAAGERREATTLDPKKRKRGGGHVESSSGKKEIDKKKAGESRKETLDPKKRKREGGRIESSSGKKEMIREAAFEKDVRKEGSKRETDATTPKSNRGRPKDGRAVGSKGSITFVFRGHKKDGEKDGDMRIIEESLTPTPNVGRWKGSGEKRAGSVSTTRENQGRPKSSSKTKASRRMASGNGKAREKHEENNNNMPETKRKPGRPPKGGRSVHKAVGEASSGDEKASSSIRKSPARKIAADGGGEKEEDLMGCGIKVWWPLDQRFYKGLVISYDAKKKRHKVRYDDGEQEILDLAAEQWQLTTKKQRLATTNPQETSAATPAWAPIPLRELDKAKVLSAQQVDAGRVSSDQSKRRSSSKTSSKSRKKKKGVSLEEDGGKSNNLAARFLEAKSRRSIKTGEKRVRSSSTSKKGSECDATRATTAALSPDTPGDGEPLNMWVIRRHKAH